MCVYSGHQFDVSSKCFWNHKLPHWNWNRQSLFQKSLHRQNQQLHATALQPLHIHPFPCCHLGPRIGGGPANTVFQNVYVSIVYTFFSHIHHKFHFPKCYFWSSRSGRSWNILVSLCLSFSSDSFLLMMSVATSAPNFFSSSDRKNHLLTPVVLVLCLLQMEM